MNLKILFSISVFPFWILSCCVKPAAKESWQISYERVEYFFGSISIKIGTDSCYYLNQGGIHKNPPIFKWKSKRKKLSALYKEIEKFKLQEADQMRASVTKEPIETLELINNGRVVFSLQKEQQNDHYQKMFDSVVTLLKSFAHTENGGWKY